MRPFTRRLLLVGTCLCIFFSCPSARAVEASELKGRVYYQRAESLGQAINTPGIFEGLPSNAVYNGGWMIPTLERLGVDFLTIEGRTYIILTTVVSYFPDGRTKDRILDVIEVSGSSYIKPCFISGAVDQSSFALLTVEEALEARKQNPDMDVNIEETVVRPRHAYRLNTKSFVFERLKSESVVCRGILSSSRLE